MQRWYDYRASQTGQNFHSSNTTASLELLANKQATPLFELLSVLSLKQTNEQGYRHKLNISS
jgi:hypothetical protein